MRDLGTIRCFTIVYSVLDKIQWVCCQGNLNGRDTPEYASLRGDVLKVSNLGELTEAVDNKLMTG